jgi:hypothetical protein
VQVGGGDDRRGENIASGDREVGCGQRIGDRCPGAGGGVGDQGQRDRGRPQPVQGRDRPGQRFPLDGQHAVDVDQHRVDAPHALTITAAATPSTPGNCYQMVSGHRHERAP